MAVFSPVSFTPVSSTSFASALFDPPAYRLDLPDVTMLVGSLEDDFLAGGMGDDFLFGFAGSDNLQGRSGDDRLFGGDGNDLLNGGKGNDQLLGEKGNDVLQGGRGDDRLDGGIGDDSLNGGAGRDRFWASDGFDKFDGGDGVDTADYGGWEDAIVLRYSVRFSLEQLSEQESEISPEDEPATDVSQSEAAAPVASSAATTDSTASDLDPLIGPFPSPSPSPWTRTILTPMALLEVQKGVLSPQSEVIGETSVSPRNDVPDISVQSIVEEAELLALPVSDVLESIETIVAPEGQRNTLDFSFRRVASQFDPNPAASAPSIDVDLSQERLSFAEADEALPGPRRLTVKNFVQVLGSSKGDRIVGDDKDNILEGGQGRDVLMGGEGDDVLITAEKDSLTGGLGRDRFEFKAVWASHSGRSGFRPKSLRPSRIEDFASGVDQLVFNREFDAGIMKSEEQILQYIPFYDLGDGVLDASQFLVLGQGDLSEQTRFVYNSETGALFYRGPEIYAALGAQLQIATLAGAPTLQASDLVAL